jgi:hypothetical protein
MLIHQFNICSVKNIQNSSYNNIYIISGMMLVCLCLQFIDTPLCTMCLLICIHTSNIDVFDGDIIFPRRTHQCEGLQLSASKTSILGVCVHGTTHIVNNDMLVNFNQIYHPPSNNIPTGITASTVLCAA